jgi:bifunctional non-homologous end joining protein LigD
VPPREPAPPTTAGSFLGVTLSHPEKVLFPEQGVTKAEVAAHYVHHMERMFRHVEGRPLTLVRCPQGRAKKCFYQRHPEGVPAHMAADIGEEGGLATVITRPSDLVELVQRGVLEIHLRGARADRPTRPDRLVFDLDPADDVPFEAVKDAAIRVREALARDDLVSFVKTTGGKGLHVVVPIERRIEWDEAKGWCRAVAARLAAAEPDRFLISMTKAKRPGRIFIDYLRNDRKASAVAPYSTRARDGAPFAVPVAWDELPRLSSAAGIRVGEVVVGPDPWAEMAAVRQRLTSGHLSAARRGS